MSTALSSAFTEEWSNRSHTQWVASCMAQHPNARSRAKVGHEVHFNKSRPLLQATWGIAGSEFCRRRGHFWKQQRPTQDSRVAMQEGLHHQLSSVLNMTPLGGSRAYVNKTFPLLPCSCVYATLLNPKRRTLRSQMRVSSVVHICSKDASSEPRRMSVNGSCHP